jgi:hypothetical protein
VLQPLGSPGQRQRPSVTRAVEGRCVLPCARTPPLDPHRNIHYLGLSRWLPLPGVTRSYLKRNLLLARHRMGSLVDLTYTPNPKGAFHNGLDDVAAIKWNTASWIPRSPMVYAFSVSESGIVVDKYIARHRTTQCLPLGGFIPSRSHGADTRAGRFHPTAAGPAVRECNNLTEVAF